MGLGFAANRAYDYTTNVPPYLTVTPTFNNKTTHSFTYCVGFGIDYVVQNISLGVGYRFINLGKTGLGAGTIRTTSINPVLTQSNLTINSVLVQINYFLK